MCWPLPKLYFVKNDFVRSGIRTHALIRGPEHSTRYTSKDTLESGALDRSAILTCDCNGFKLNFAFYKLFLQRCVDHCLNFIL